MHSLFCCEIDKVSVQKTLIFYVQGFLVGQCQKNIYSFCLNICFLQKMQTQEKKLSHNQFKHFHLENLTSRLNSLPRAGKVNVCPKAWIKCTGINFIKVFCAHFSYQFLAPSQMKLEKTTFVRKIRTYNVDEIDGRFPSLFTGVTYVPEKWTLEYQIHFFGD